MKFFAHVYGALERAGVDVREVGKNTDLWDIVGNLKIFL